MTVSLRHAVIIPARNEEGYLRRAVQSLQRQADPPGRIVVVDDGSTDATGRVARELSAGDPSVRLVAAAPVSEGWWGPRVVAAFERGYEDLDGTEIEYVSKFDADIEFPPDYCSRVLQFLDAHPDVGIAGGTLLELQGSSARPYRLPREHVPGALKTYRNDLLKRMGGLPRVSGWDIVDMVKARTLGVRTVRLIDLAALHLRPQGGSVSPFRARMHWGLAAYAIRSHPMFVLGRGAYRMLEPPYLLGGLAFYCGYVLAAVKRVPRLQDETVAAQLRREQLHRLLAWNRLPADR